MTRHWPWVVAFWIALPLALRLVAPAWESVTHDGDLAFLPSTMTSVRGESLLAEAFPNSRAKSQVVVIVAREDGRLQDADYRAASDLARRFYNRLGAANFERGRQLQRQLAALRAAPQPPAERIAELERQLEAAKRIAERGFAEAIRMDEAIAEYAQEVRSASGNPLPAEGGARLAEAYHNRGLWHAWLGEPEQAQSDRRLAASLDPALARRGGSLAPDGAAEWPLLDVWTWDEQILGEKLRDKKGQAVLIVLQLANEFMATENIRVLEGVEETLADVRQSLDPSQREGLVLGVSGSAAVGGDMLRAASESIRDTELWTIVLVLFILLLVYRSPLLALVPLTAIAASLYASTSLIALLTQLDRVPGFGWWDLQVFTTTKIFIVVILFGAGTDYCLFLIARFKEELDAGRSRDEAIAAALSGVGDALAASAMTTILGLGMMWFADFGKFKHSGPVIGLCLFITLIACLTLAPAMLSAFGGALFWPYGAQARRAPGGGERSGRLARMWRWTARQVTLRPGMVLLGSLALLAPFATLGIRSSRHITYDLLSSLSPDRPTRRGAELLERHFPIGESGPLTVVARRERANFADAENKEARAAIAELTERLYVSGVVAVRSLNDPLGDFPPGSKMPLFSRRAWRTRILRPHQRNEEIFVSQSPQLAGEVTRLEVVLSDSPFSTAAAETLVRIDRELRQLGAAPDSFWHGAQFAYAGVTAGVADLKAVTQSDNSRIQVLVVLAVWIVLLAILRRPLVSIYMMASVLLSYFVTMGITELFFAWAYGSTYVGIDWKAPLFLFVILVAVGQDYNVYLATRVFEEQTRRGPFAGLREGMIRTGGIITSCGVIMAGAFISMTSGAWWSVLPEWLGGAFSSGQGGPLRTIVQLGFALSLGVLLDTFVIRPILLPAFLALLCRWQAKPAAL